MILYTEGKSEGQASDAEKIMGILCTAYPGHPWAVRVDEGLIFIRYLNTLLQGNWGMVLKTREVDHDAAVLKRRVISLAGEWLERSGLKRGREDGDEIQHVEGVPEKWQTTKETNAIVAVDGSPLRTTPRRG